MYCKYCGKEIQEDSAYCKHCGKGQVFTDPPEQKTIVMTTTAKVKFKNPYMIFFAVMLAVSALGSVLYYVSAIRQNEAVTSAVISSFSQDGAIDKATFNKIKNKMSYKQVVKLIGVEGELVSSYGEGEYNTFIMKWDGYGASGANAVITFQNNMVVGKAQAGLQ